LKVLDNIAKKRLYSTKLKGGELDGSSILFQVQGKAGDQESPTRCAKEQEASDQGNLPGVRDKGIPHWQVVSPVSPANWL